MYEQNQNDNYIPNDYLMLNPETVNYQNQYVDALNPPIIDLGAIVESVKDKVKNCWEDLVANSQQQFLNSNQEYPPLAQLAYQQNSSSIEPQPNPLEYDNQNSIIHEELAQKTKEIQDLQIEDGENKKRISKLEKQINKLKKERKLLGWVKRAINDSQNNRII